MPHVIGSTALCASALLLYLCCLLNNTLLMPTVCQALPQALGTLMDGTALPLGSSQGYCDTDERRVCADTWGLRKARRGLV